MPRKAQSSLSAPSSAPSSHPLSDTKDPLARTVRLLALATSGQWCSVALYRRGSGIDESECLSEPLGLRQSQNILRMVDELCTGAAVDLAQLDAIAFDAGPGSFTGLRVACAVAQGLGFALDRPLIPVDTLQSLAWQRVRVRARRDASVLVVNDARMDELYVALYRVHEDAGRDAAPGCDQYCPPVVEALIEPCLVARDRFVEEMVVTLRERIEPIDPVSLQLAGDAWQRLGLDRSWLTRCGLADAAVPGENDAYVHADALAELAHAHWCAGRTIDPAAAVPRYLRDKVALDRDEQQALRARRDERAHD